MIWMKDHAEYLTWKEYNYWMGCALPFGWAIMSMPLGRDAPPTRWHRLLQFFGL